MSTNSGVQWCHHSHGFWYGCRKVSPGCAKCYAERDMNRYGRDFAAVTRSKSFDAPAKWLSSGRAVPGDRIFVCPWSDFLIKEADQWRKEALYIMKQCDDLNFLILTKRIERLVEIQPDMFELLPNAWLGVSIEDQEQANLRLPLLMECKARVRWASFEPLLERVSLTDAGLHSWDKHRQLDWAVIGGESDYKNPRIMDPEWAVDLINQLRIRGTINHIQGRTTPVFFKQMGGSKKIGGHWGGNQIKGKVIEEFPN